MTKQIAVRLEATLGERPGRLIPMGGGCVGEVYRTELASGERVVVKLDRSGSGTLDVEGRMLGDLSSRSRLPVPSVLLCEPDLLVMEFIDEGSGASPEPDAQGRDEHAADLLASLHEIGPDGPSAFGYEYDTLIGGLHQPNPWTDGWLEFFREHRLLFMAREAARAGRLPGSVLKSLERLSERLDDVMGLADVVVMPALIHGDVWGGNVLADRDRVWGFIDPAIYFAHEEIELAFTTMFSTFGDGFYRRYDERRGIDAGFWDVRRDLYNLYPLLVHVRLFGGGYVGSVEATLRRFVD